MVTTHKLGMFIFEVNEFKPIVALMEAWKGHSAEASLTVSAPIGKAAASLIAKAA